MDDAVKWVRVASAGSLRKGEMMAVAAAGRSLALYHLTDGTWHASDNVCTHAFALLTDGWLEGYVVECPLHAGRFDLRSGAGLGAPIETDLTIYPVRVDGDEVFVRLPADLPTCRT
jgi:nitrite reductase/ring-hydroxylating ferredoxin subunit